MFGQAINFLGVSLSVATLEQGHGSQNGPTVDVGFLMVFVLCVQRACIKSL